jgi:hypothetical protein
MATAIADQATRAAAGLFASVIRSLLGGQAGGFWRALAVVMVGLEVPLSGYLLVVPWLADLVGALDGCEAARGGRSRAARRLAPVVALGAISALAALARGPLLPTLAGRESVVFCDYLARCEERDEDRCLLEAANLGPSLPEPACLSCITRHDSCDEVALGCEAQCWPE